MKKLLSVLGVLMAAALLVATFAACATESEVASEDEVVQQADGQNTYKIGICQLVQHPALDQATQGFQDALKEKLGDNVTFDVQNASGEATNCTTIVSKFVSDNVDLIMANATDALAAAVQATDRIPIVATSITDYATALGMSDWTGKTGFNVTGTADLAPLDEQAAMIKELVPDAKNVGILYCSAEKNSKYQADIVADELSKMDIESKMYTFVDSNDITNVTQQMVADKVDAVYIPTDNTAANNVNAINNILEPAKIPVIAGEVGICEGTGVATLSISYYDIGHEAGLMAYDILVNGSDPADMDIKYATELTKQYMKDRAEALGIDIPEGYAEIVVENE